MFPTNLDQCKKWLQNRDLHEHDSTGDTLLHRAIMAADPRWVDFLMDKGANPTTPGAIGLSPLELARYLNQPHLARRLGDPAPPTLRVQLKGSTSVEALSTDRFSKLTGIPYLSFMNFVSYDNLKTVHDLATYVHQKGYMHTERVWMGMTYRKELDQGLTNDVSIRWIDDTLGYGLFAERPIRMWEVIGVYTGEIRKRPLFRREMGDYAFRYPIGEIYEKKYVVDSAKGGNVTRFINHSDDPNLTTSGAYYKGLMHMVVFAHRTIAAGQQLCFDYGEFFWQGRDYVSRP